MITRRKGITPVIAIVLLLLITVGAVGVVYTQFQGLVEGNDAQEQLNQQQRIQQSSYSIIAVTQASGNYQVTVQNTGDVTLSDLNNKAVLRVGTDGESPQAIDAVGSSCDWNDLAPGDTQNCDTGVSWGNSGDGEATTIEFQVGETTKDTYSCFENGDGACGQ